MGYTIEFGNGIFPTSKGSMAGTITDNDTGKVFNTALFCGRNSEKTGTTRESLVYSAKVFEPAVRYIDGVPNLNNEPQGENLFLFSEDFTGSGWSNQRATITKDSANPSIQVDKNSTKWQLTSETGVKYLRVGATRTGDYYFSIYAKKGNYRYLGLTNTNPFKTVFDFDTKSIVVGAGYSEVEELNDGWFRISSMVTWSGSFTYTGIYYTDETGADLTVSTGEEFFYIDAAQVETNSLSSYIVTNGSAQTRLADTGFKTTNLSKYIDSSIGSIEVAYRVNLTSNSLISLTDGSFDNRIFILGKTSAQNLDIYYQSSGQSLVAINATIDDSEKVKIRVVWGDGFFSLYVNDALIETKSIVNIGNGVLNMLALESPTSSDPFKGDIEYIKIE